MPGPAGRSGRGGADEDAARVGGQRQGYGTGGARAQVFSAPQLGQALRPGVAERAAAVGLELLDLGLKDLVLPGEMKVLLNRVIEAQNEAEANVILRREETAATRSMAQTAKVLAENPLLVRLKELEGYKELAGKVGQVNLVLGTRGPAAAAGLKT